MRVVRLAQGTHWTICAACSGSGCPVVEFVADLESKGGRDAKRARKILADLTTYAPNSTNGEWAKTEFSKDLGSEIYEYRWDGKGGVPRVLWFYDENKIVVCVHAVLKKDHRIEPQDIEVAIQRRNDYLAAKAAGQLTLIEADDLDDN
jgi:phage-related protein